MVTFIVILESFKETDSLYKHVKFQLSIALIDFIKNVPKVIKECIIRNTGEKNFTHICGVLFVHVYKGSV